MSIIIAWLAVTTYVGGAPITAPVGYELEVLKDGSHLVTLDAGAQTRLDVGTFVVRGPLYTVRVRAVVDGIRSDWSAPLELRLPPLEPAVPAGLEQKS